MEPESEARGGIIASGASGSDTALQIRQSQRRRCEK